MDRYFARTTVESSEKRARIDSNVASDDVVSDPALRKSINDYEPFVFGVIFLEKRELEIRRLQKMDFEIGRRQ